jgi:hypothetical protein
MGREGFGRERRETRRAGKGPAREMGVREAVGLFACTSLSLTPTPTLPLSLSLTHTQVEIRSASRLASAPDGGRQERRLESIRAALGWEQVPIIRNRSRLFGVIESPFDTFGPTPPAGLDPGTIELGVGSD